MNLHTKNNVTHLHLSSLCSVLMLFTLVACETTAPPVTSSGGEIAGAMAGATAGDSAGESGGESAGASAGERAGTNAGDMGSGEEAGDEAGEEAGDSSGTEIIIEAGDEAGNMIMTPTFNPDEPLPTPQATSMSPPSQIAEPSDAALDSGCDGEYVSEVRGWVVDEVGTPMPGAKVQLCVRVYATGELLCIQPKDTRAEGYFSIAVPESARCMADAAFRALVPRVAFAPMYCHADFTDERSDAVLRLTEPLVLYQTRPVISTEDLGDSSQPHKVELIGDLALTLIPDDLYGPELSEIGGRALSADAPGLCFLHSSTNPESDPQIDGIYAFAPEGDLTGSTAAARFPNTAGYAAGAEVNIYVLGNLDCSVEGQMESLEEASWSIQARATVDESGMWIETVAGEGLPCLSWFGYGLAP